MELSNFYSVLDQIELFHFDVVDLQPFNLTVATFQDESSGKVCLQENQTNAIVQRNDGKWAASQEKTALGYLNRPVQSKKKLEA